MISEHVKNRLGEKNTKFIRTGKFLQLVTGIKKHLIWNYKL